VPQRPTLGTPANAQGFKTSNPCWDTGFFVEKGFTYELVVEMAEPLLDGPKVVDIAGFRDSSWPHLLATPLKRWWNVEWPIRSVEGFEPLELDDQAKVSTGLSSEVCKPAQPSLKEVQNETARIEHPNPT
jgi:hypothetical protein